MAEKILALLAAYALGVGSSVLIYRHLVRTALLHFPQLRAQARHALDEIEMEAFRDEEGKK